MVRFWMFQLLGVILLFLCPSVRSYNCLQCVTCLPQSDSTQKTYPAHIFSTYQITRCPLQGDPDYFLLSQILFLYPDKLTTTNTDLIPCYQECRRCVAIIKKSCSLIQPLPKAYWGDLYQGLFYQSAKEAAEFAVSWSNTSHSVDQSNNSISETPDKPEPCQNHTVTINNVNSNGNNNTVVIANCGHCKNTGSHLVITNTNSGNNINTVIINSNNDYRDGSEMSKKLNTDAQPRSTTENQDESLTQKRSFMRSPNSFRYDSPRRKRSTDLCCETTMHLLPYTGNVTVGDETWYAVRFYNPCEDLPYHYQMCEHANCSSDCLSADSPRAILMTSNRPSETYGHFFTIFSSFFMDNVKFVQVPLPGYCVCLS